MRILKFILLFAILSFLPCATCIPDNVIIPPKLGKTVFKKVAFDVVYQQALGDYGEVLHFSWTRPSTDSNAISSFELLRKTGYDTTFELYKNIPFPDTNDYYDPVENTDFPLEGYDSVYFRILAVDTVGNPGDTSAICTLYIAPKPVFDTLAGQCLNWHHSGFSHLSSYIRIWSDSLKKQWTSDEIWLFTDTDQDAKFQACIPDSLLPTFRGKWYYGIFITASERYSILSGYLDVQ